MGAGAKDARRDASTLTKATSMTKAVTTATMTMIHCIESMDAVDALPMGAAVEVAVMLEYVMCMSS